MKVKYQLRFLTTPSFVFKDNRISKNAQNIYCFVHNYTGEHFYFGNKNLSQMFNITEQAVDRAIKELKDLKYVSTFQEPSSTGGKVRYVTDNMGKSRSIKSDTYQVSNLIVRDEAAEVSNLIVRDEAKLASPKDNNKDNNIKEDFLENILENRKQKQSLKGSSSFGGYSGRPKYPERREKKGTYAEDIV